MFGCVYPQKAKGNNGGNYPPIMFEHFDRKNLLVTEGKEECFSFFLNVASRSLNDVTPTSLFLFPPADPFLHSFLLGV